MSHLPLVFTLPPATAALAAEPSPRTTDFYDLALGSKPQANAPKLEVIRFTIVSRIHDALTFVRQVYVPTQYHSSKPAGVFLGQHRLNLFSV